MSNIRSPSVQNLQGCKALLLIVLNVNLCLHSDRIISRKTQILAILHKGSQFNTHKTKEKYMQNRHGISIHNKAN